jgi:hypothetical protein
MLTKERQHSCSRRPPPGECRRGLQDAKVSATSASKPAPHPPALSHRASKGCFGSGRGRPKLLTKPPLKIGDHGCYTRAAQIADCEAPVSTPSRAARPRRATSRHSSHPLDRPVIDAFRSFKAVASVTRVAASTTFLLSRGRPASPISDSTGGLTSKPKRSGRSAAAGAERADEPVDEHADARRRACHIVDDTIA